MRISTWIKLALVTTVLVLGWRADGSWKGAAAWAMIVGFVWFVWAMLNHEPAPPESVRKTPQQFISEFQATADFKEQVTGPSRRGTRLNPDPTRPTEDDYAALITTIIERNR